MRRERADLRVRVRVEEVAMNIAGITHELREHATANWDPWTAARDWLFQMCDHIDAEHAKVMLRAGQLLEGAEEERDRNYANWQECKQKVLQLNITIDELSAEVERLKDELTHRIELPKDADDKYINIGDRVENNERVVRIVLTDGSWEPSVYTEKSPNVLQEYFCNEVSHYHKPTVEDVLRDFAQAMSENMGLYTGEAIDANEWRDADAKTVEKYAAKVREVMAE